MTKRTLAIKLTMTEVLRQAIRNSGRPLLRIAQETGVARASLTRFVSGQRSLRLDCADKLAAYFDLTLTHKDS